METNEKKINVVACIFKQTVFLSQLIFVKMHYEEGKTDLWWELFWWFFNAATFAFLLKPLFACMAHNDQMLLPRSSASAGSLSPFKLAGSAFAPRGNSFLTLCYQIPPWLHWTAAEIRLTSGTVQSVPAPFCFYCVGRAGNTPCKIPTFVFIASAQLEIVSTGHLVMEQPFLNCKTPPTLPPPHSRSYIEWWQMEEFYKVCSLCLHFSLHNHEHGKGERGHLAMQQLFLHCKTTPTFSIHACNCAETVETNGGILQGLIHGKIPPFVSAASVWLWEWKGRVGGASCNGGRDGPSQDPPPPNPSLSATTELSSCRVSVMAQLSQCQPAEMALCWSNSAISELPLGRACLQKGGPAMEDFGRQLANMYPKLVSRFSTELNSNKNVRAPLIGIMYWTNVLN